MKSKKVNISGRKIYHNDLNDAGSLCYFSLYRFATNLDIFFIFIGIIFTCLKSLAMPILIIVYGEFTTLLVYRTNYGTSTHSPVLFLPIFGGGRFLVNATEEENRQEIINDSVAYGILLALTSLLHLFAGIVCVDCFNHTALRQITRIRMMFFQSLMCQEIGWYDVTGGNNNFTVRMTEDIEKIRDAIAEKVSHFLYLVISFLICVVISFIYGWKLSCVVISYVPIVIATNYVIGKFQATLSTKELNSYAAAANVAEEALSGIRTVFAFGGEKIERLRYNSRLINAKKAVKAKGLLTGLGDGITRGLFFGSNALAFWYGVQLVLNDRDKVDKEYTPAVLMITFFGLTVGGENLAKIPPFLETFASACGSGASIFRVIDRISKIDSMSNEGKVPNLGVQGNIVFKNVFFTYPSRPDAQILNGLNLKIEAGHTVALVGNSGNGKSTCLQLLQRFYDPDQGAVLIDGCDIRTLNINTLRSNIATVSQEPIMFSTTIYENIRYGNPDATDKDIVAAAQMAGARDFIARLPQGYNTMVGEKGSQLSGGQRQRIAIARALVQNPNILLLDEATSALDYHSEKQVQETLDRASEGRTTIVVSHRLSAIRNADRILFIDKGIVVEDGTHTELMAMKGRYFDMITIGRLEYKNTVNEYHENPLKISIKQFFNDQNVQQEYIKNSTTDCVKGKLKKPTESVDYWTVFKRILELMKPDWVTMFLATNCAFIIGASLPILAILFAEIYGALSLSDTSLALNQTFIICMAFLLVAVVTFIAAVCQTYCFSTASINLAIRVRSLTFAALVKQECEWFDDEKNSSASFSALTGDAASLQNALCYPLSVIFQSISTLVIGMFIAFNYSFKLSLLSFAAFPLSLLAVLLEARHMSKSAIVEKQTIEIGIKIATEAINNIRTVASLRLEAHMIYRYAREMEIASSIIRKKIIWRGFYNSIAQCIPFISYSVALCYGGFLVANGEVHFKNVIKVTEALLYGTFEMNQSLVYVPSLTTAFVAAHHIFRIIDRIPMITSPNIANKHRKSDKSHNIDYKKVDFRYPTRPDVQVLNGFNLSIAEGKTVALVGPSGCGKSTCIQLLQRFYDPEQGRIHIGLDEISTDITLKNLRSKLSIVSQEPTLFDRTIAENIAYADNSREVSMGEIIECARLANAHEFIAKLPLGYETNVGSKSAQLSGGQKQRIAIARALIRNPKILLLDEATSALDLHSEKTVQVALDSARSGRTCIIIAHRLSTIQNADIICVVENGRIVESGSHTTLLTMNGIYTSLYNAQK